MTPLLPNHMAAKTREDAWQLVTEFVQDEGLRRHMLAVSVAMHAYAVRLGEEPTCRKTSPM